MSDLMSLLPSTAAIVNGVIAVIVAQFFKDHPIAKAVLVVTAVVLGAASISATFYSLHLIADAKVTEDARLQGIRDRLGMFIEDGDKLLQAGATQTIPITPTLGAEWYQAMVKYLQVNLGHSYVQRLNDSAGAPIDSPIGVDDQHRQFYLAIRLRLLRLEQFSQELKRP